MSNKYLADGMLNLSDLKHDIGGLIEPLALSINLMNSDKKEKALFLQQEILKNLKSIVESLNSISNSSENKTSRLENL